MLVLPRASRRVHHGGLPRAGRKSSLLAVRPRNIYTIAIESSCDDTSVAVLQRDNGTRLLFHEKVTANNDAYNGIHPLVALHSHQTSLAPLIQRAIQHFPVESETAKRKPAFVTVTRGPGMRSNLSVGLDTAKGLAVAWQVPLLGVHHMQAHALTPRLISALHHENNAALKPEFPFLTILASGGHTMLIDSAGLTEHKILAQTEDIALGDCLDKAARAILPKSLVLPPYGRALERFAFPNGAADYNYTPPVNREGELQRRRTAWGWGLGPPMAESKGGRSSRRMAFSFSGLLSSIERFIKFEVEPSGAITKNLRAEGQLGEDERRVMAKEVMRVAFEHLASRVALHLSSLTRAQAADVKTVVISGGVAANAFLRHVMRRVLDVRGYEHIELSFPPIELCTDNAAMIAWAGMEMWDAGWRSDLSIQPIKSWSMDPSATDGGILGPDGWIRRALDEK
ncbi:Mitochondrial tRNAs modification protein [Zalaria obscura]|uniref:Mitochondrial tRNAs modification protein n=1 Tax=Zalaria obscura TaxID=2024903 RepID=A0ACC3S943_9PEZI